MKLLDRIAARLGYVSVAQYMELRQAAQVQIDTHLKFREAFEDFLVKHYPHVHTLAPTISETARREYDAKIIAFDPTRKKK